MKTLAMDPLAEPNKIAFAGDWHGKTLWATLAIDYAAAQGANVIVHLGDYGYTFTDYFRARVELALRRASIPLLFVDGNHEDHDWLGRKRKQPNGLVRISNHVWHLPRGFRWTWSGTRFLALGGAYSVDQHRRIEGRSWWRGEEITPRQAERAVNGGLTDVLISHDCPAGVDIPGLEDSAHCFPAEALAASDRHRQLLRQVADVVQPKVIWHGHYHCQYDTVSDLGYGPVEVHGLDCDATELFKNVTVVKTADVA